MRAATQHHPAGRRCWILARAVAALVILSPACTHDATVTGSGGSLMVNNAKVICGGVKTANATVYLIDTVLMPPAS